MDRLSERTDGELVELARGGDRSAFAVLYDRYVDAIHGHLARVLRDVAEAQDLTQDTFIAALESLDQLQQPERFRPWLYRIATNRAFDRIARRRRTRLVGGTRGGDERDVLLDHVDPDRLNDPVTATVAGEVAAIVWEAAESLDPRTRAVLDLHVRHDLDSGEIADVMGVKRNHAYQLVHRMKERVQGAIGTTLLVRKGSEDCDRLRAVVAGAPVPPVSEGLRRSVERHVEDCETCQETRRRLLAPMSAYAALAAVPPTDAFREELWRELDRRFPYGDAPAGRSGPGPAAVATMALITGLVVATAVVGLQLRQELAPDVQTAPQEVAAMPVTEPIEPAPADVPQVITPATEEPGEDETIPPVVVATTPPATTPPPPEPEPTPTATAEPTPTPTETATDPGPGDQPPSAEIRSPRDGQTIDAQDLDGDGDYEGLVDLFAAAEDAETPTEQLSVAWTSDRDGVLAETLNAQGVLLSHDADCATVTAVVPTQHTIRLTVSDSAGQVVTREVTVAVQCPVG